MNRVLYDGIRQVLRAWFRVAYRTTIVGEANLPAAGGAVLASNHQSFFDPMVVASAIRTRRVHFAARENLFRPFGGEPSCGRSGRSRSPAAGRISAPSARASISSEEATS